jgi:hypothetical protein
MNNRMPRFLIVQSLIFFLILLPLILPKESFSQDPRGVDVAPEQTKRSCIIAADGYAYVSDYSNLAEAKAAAYSNGKRQALEAAKAYLISKTSVTDFEAKYDLKCSDAEDAVKVLEHKDHGVQDKARYHVWIKAEISYNLKPKKPSVSIPSSMGKDAPLTVKVWTPKKEYKDGESMEIYVQGNRDFYARIIDITSSGDIIQLLPNNYRNINSFKAGKLYSIPDQEDHFGLVVTAPCGEDRIVVYASDVPLGQINMEPLDQGLGLYKGDLESLATAARQVSTAPCGSGPYSVAEFYEAVWAIATECGEPRYRGTRKEGPERPIDMTGAAGAKKPFDAPGDLTR